jgi:hypothetical protein
MPFRPAQADTLRRLVVSLWGDPKVGKTHFALTCPEPIRYLNLDFGVAELVPRFAGKQIEVSDLQLADVGSLRECSRILEQFYKDYLWALEHSAGGTVVVDTATQVWQLVQTVKLEEVKERRAKKKGGDPDEVQLYPYDYAQANVLMSSILRRALHHEGVNTVFIHRSKKRFNARGEELPGTEFQGFNETPAIAQVTLHLFTEGKQHRARIEKCRFDTSLEGGVFADLTYDTLRALCLPAEEGTA